MDLKTMVQSKAYLGRRLIHKQLLHQQLNIKKAKIGRGPINPESTKISVYDAESSMMPRDNTNKFHLKNKLSKTRVTRN